MPAEQLDLVIEKGATFSKQLTWKDSDGNAINLTGFTARMQVRRDYNSESVLIELTTENGRITLGGAAGTVLLTISATDTAAIDWTNGRYDLELVSGAVVTRLIEGLVTVTEEVTR